MSLDVQRISLDISKQPTPQQVRLGQGDANATQLIVDVFDDGVAYDLSSYSVRLLMRLPNDGGYYDVDGTHSGNVATFDIDESYAAAVHGFDGFGYVDILSGSTVICSTSRFQLVVLQCASDGVGLSEQYIDSVNDAIDRANAAAAAAEGVVLQDVPLMSTTVRGGAQLGTGLEITSGVLSLGAHTHAAATDLTGQVPVANGGTGAASASDARTNLGITPANIGAAASSHVHSAADITSGELAIANGGTGASTASGALSNLGALPTAGGTMTGTLGFDSATSLPHSALTSGFYPVSLNDSFANDGTLSYMTKAEFKTALDISGINTVKTDDVSTDVDVAASTYKSIASLSLEAGTWVVSYGSIFAANTTGQRFMFLYTTANSAGTNQWYRETGVQVGANGTGTRYTILHGSHVYTPTATTTVYLTLWQNSGSQLACSGYLRAVKIG